ncbi:MAG: redoxin domain-containing protein [Acidobacteria bacterium]|nr:redoxin domain-containing protein [Acidobacteriota bacterium]MCA1637513.1 redoxin domain-containing protein [Acidobacteriota bacterium]
MKTFLALAILLTGFSFAYAQGEQAPLLEKEIQYKDWTYKNVRDEKEINLRDFAKNKKLVMVVYFAPWCPNWKTEAPIAQRLYDKYKANGFDVIGVGEYDTVAAMKTNLNDQKITFPVVYESDTKDAKQKTLHYEYRKAAGDTRGWGSPWNIFLEPKSLEKKGDVLTKKAFVVNGELIEAEVEKFVRQNLGLTAEETKADKAQNKIVEACDPEKKITTLKKP